MSESGDDFGGFGAPTPIRPKAVAASAKPSSSRTQAGPSRNAGAAARRKLTSVDDSDIDELQAPPAKKPKATARGRKRQEQEHEVEEDEGALHNVDEEDVEEGDIEEIDPPRPKGKGRLASKKPTSAVNGNAGSNTLASAAAKGKGKAKAKPTPKTRQLSIEEMEIEFLAPAAEPMHVEEVEEDARQTVKPERPTARGTKNAKPSPRSSARYDAEITRLKEQLIQANNHITDLKLQLQELSQVRHTEPEQLLERMEAQHQAQIQAQDNLIEDLKAKLSQSDPLLRSGKKAVFELLTREEANKETEKLQNQLKTYKEAVRERDQSIKDKDEKIKDLEQEKNDLQYELKLEIERGKTLQAKAQRQPMGSASRSNGGLVAPHQDPKIGEVVKFYEDLSNIIIPSIKVQPGRYLSKDECVLTCCYTYKDVTDPTAISKSLYFTLRLCYDLKPDTSEPVVSLDQLVQSVHYIPRELDKESPEFVASLGFLSDTFTFERDQLSLFLRTLYEFISGEGGDSKGGKEDDSDDSSVELVQ